MDTRVLMLGGMTLISNHGDVDIDERGSKIRLQRADLDDIIKFLQQARRDAR